MKSQNLYQNAKVPNNKKFYPRSVARFFSTRDSSFKIEPGRATYVVFPLGTDCDTPTSTCVGPNCRCMKRTISNCAAGRLLPCDRYPWYSPRVVLCSSVLTLRVRARLGGLRVYFSAGLSPIGRTGQRGT